MNKSLILYRLSPNRESKIAICTQFEMGVANICLLRYSQYHWKQWSNTGSALHLNLANLPDKEFFLWLRNLAAKYHTTYWTTNVKTTICNDCGHIDFRTLDKCPACGSKNLDFGVRIIGYLRKISNFSNDRQAEEKMRYYH